jgi:Ser/Thr protein kinase RdoA (MazF antagonist)
VTTSDQVRDEDPGLQGREALARVIREFYDVGFVEMPVPVPLAHQRRHRKLMVTTGAGKFLIKTYKRDPYVLDALRFQHRLSQHLDEHGLPVARILPAKTGKKIVEGDDWALELQQFVDGTPMEVTSETLAISAHALGQMHDVCRDFPRPERDVRMWRFSEVPRTLFAQFFEMAKASGDEAEVTAQCNEIALFLRDASQELSFEARNRFETGLIHGDWHGGNLIFKDDRLQAIVDLEFAGDGCFLEDLAYGISNLCVRTTMKPERLAKRTDIMLGNYQKHRNISAYEQVALYYAVGVKHVATVSYQALQTNGVVAGYSARSWMERLANQCRWLSERARSVRWG